MLTPRPVDVWINDVGAVFTCPWCGNHEFGSHGNPGHGLQRNCNSLVGAQRDRSCGFQWPDKDDALYFFDRAGNRFAGTLAKWDRPEVYTCRGCSGTARGALPARFGAEHYMPPLMPTGWSRRIVDDKPVFACSSACEQQADAKLGGAR